MADLLTLPNVSIVLVLVAALAGWIGWLLAGARASSGRRNEEAWESEVVRAAGCARDRAVQEKEQIEERLRRLQTEHGRCEERFTDLTGKLRKAEAAMEAAKQKHAAALAARKESDARVRALDRRVEDLERSIEERNRSDGTPGWLIAEPDDVVDDLTAIRGLGKTIERRLNDLGIYLYSQLAQMSTQNAQWIAMKIHVVSGRILRDRWAEQARELHRRKYGTDLFLQQKS